MNERYKAVEGSKTAHFCFKATVIDTTESEIIICECFDMEDAQKIADALNATYRKQGQSKEKTYGDE